MSTPIVKIKAGHYHGYPFFNHSATISKNDKKGTWEYALVSDGKVVAHGVNIKTKRACEQAITEYGYRNTAIVKNLLSGKDVELPLNQVGTCCDPSTERYHCM